MSKFVDKLKKLSENAVLHIGFRASVDEPEVRSALLIAGLSRLDDEESAVLAGGEVDAGLAMGSGFTSGTIGQMVKAANGVPLGVLLKDISEDEANELAGSGCDFTVLHSSMPPMALHGERAGKFLMVEVSLEVGRVRAINGLEVDGVFLNCGGSSSFTVETLLLCRHFMEMLDKPLMVILPASANREVFRNLCRLGVSGIVVPATVTGETLAEVRKVMGESSREARRSRSRAAVILPHDDGRMVAEEDDI